MTQACISNGLPIASSTRRRLLLGEGVALPPDMAEMSDRVAEATELAIHALQEGDVDKACSRWFSWSKCWSGPRRQLLEQVMDRGASADRKTALAIDQASITLNRAGKHALDIAEQALFAVKGVRVELNR